MQKKRIITILGTRPEVIKLAPVIRNIELHAPIFEHKIVTTAQHREMLDQVLDVFNIRPDVDLGLMQQNQELSDFASRSLASLGELYSRLEPDCVLIQGDTTTVMTAALAAFYKGVRVGHVEAGLRSFDRNSPFPEEMNRRIAGCLANLHFAPTERARANLLREGVPNEAVFLTGNTIVDALNTFSADDSFETPSLSGIGKNGRRLLLVTAHRRENHGEPLMRICQALKRLTSIFEDVEVVYPVHLNPRVNLPVRRELGNIERIHLVDPVTYTDLLRLLMRCHLVLTDSGGIQEEAPSFRKPVLVLREITERPEVIENNAGRLVGTDAAVIVEAASRLLTDEAEYEAMCAARNPFGDGHAAERIVEILARQL